MDIGRLAWYHLASSFFMEKKQMGLRDGIGFSIEVYGTGALVWESRENDVNDLTDLFHQLSQSSTNLLNNRKLLALTLRPDFILVLARSEAGHIIGMGTLTVKETLIKRSGYVDDVVVNSLFREYGIGKAIMDHLIGIAKNRKLSYIALTSDPDNPDRVPARYLYQKLGFKERNGYFRLEL